GLVVVGFSGVSRSGGSGGGGGPPRGPWRAGRGGRQPLHVLREPLRVQRLDRRDDASVQSPPPVLQDAPVGHLVRQRMLEGVFEVREDARLVQELGRLEVTQGPTHVVLGRVSNGLQQREGHILPNDRGGLEQT